jgi:phage-related protein
MIGLTERRLLYWEGSAKKDFKRFPIPIQKDMGVALFLVQLGQMPPSAKPLKGLGAGVFELVDDHMSDTYRVAYVVNVGESIHVLHAFQKKSKKGSKTPKADIDLIKQRLRFVLQRYGLQHERG